MKEISMLDNTLTINYNASAIVMTRMKEGNYSSEYRGVNGSDKLVLSISHTMPSNRGGSGASHLVRLDVEYYDVEGTYLRTESAWQVVKTFDNSQVDTTAKYTAEALHDVAADATLLGKIIAGES